MKGRRPGALIAIALCAAVIGSVGAPLITAVATALGVSLGAAQWTLTITLFTGAIAVDEPGPRPRIDVPGALLLGIGTLGVLFLVAEPTLWSRPVAVLGVLAATVVALAAWVTVELRAEAPLVDLRLITRRPVLAANAAMLIASVGMYLLFSDLTRYVQVPDGAPYGFSLPGIAAGAALIPFSSWDSWQGRRSRGSWNGSGSGRRSRAPRVPWSWPPDCSWWVATRCLWSSRRSDCSVSASVGRPR